MNAPSPAYRLFTLMSVLMHATLLKQWPIQIRKYVTVSIGRAENAVLNLNSTTWSTNAIKGLT